MVTGTSRSVGYACCAAAHAKLMPTGVSQETREFYFANASPRISNREAQASWDFSTEGYIADVAVGAERSRRVLSVLATNLEGERVAMLLAADSPRD